MPTYFARGVTAHLGAMPLDDAVTPRIILKKGEAAKELAATAEGKMLGSRPMKEELVPFPGDPDCFQLNWLGNAPFMQARAFFEKEGARDTSEAGAHMAEARRRAGLKSRGKQSRRSEDSFAQPVANDNLAEYAAADDKPQALVLHVELSSKTFVSGLYGEKTSLKIDVFLHGQLTTSWFMPTYEVRSGVKSHHQVFAGTRVDFLAERPWVILPPGLGADGAAGKNKNSPSVEQRWREICQALQDEARERGTNEEGGVPPTADFLGALASMQMPEQVRDMQKTGGKVFGTVDVVITAGEGRKLTSGIGYLKTPRRLADENYPLVLQSNGVITLPLVEETRRINGDPEPQTPFQATSDAIDEDAEGDSDPDFEPQPKKQALKPRVLAMQDASTASGPSSQWPVMGPSRPSVLPPLQMKIVGLLPSAATKPSARLSPPAARSAGRTNMASSPTRSQVHEQDLEEQDIRDHCKIGMHSSGVKPRDLSPDLPPNMYTPQMFPSPYTLHFSDPALQGTAPSQLMRQASYVNTIASSPLDRLRVHSNGQSPPFPVFMPAAGRKEVPFGSNPYVLPFPMAEQARRGSFDVQFPPRHYHSSSMGPPISGPSDFSAPMPRMLPQAPTPFGHHGSRPPLLSYPPYSPHDHRLSGPLPPAALYTVPMKPKRSVSPQKDPGSRRLSEARSTIIVSRFVISGLKGVKLVDQRWNPAKRVDLLASRTHVDQSRSVSPVKRKMSIVPVEDIGMPRGPRRSSRNTVKVDTPPPKCPIQPHDPLLSTMISRRGGDVANQAQAMDGPDASAFDGNLSSYKPELFVPIRSKELTTMKTEQPVMAPTTTSLRAIKPMPQRRNASGNSILGVHGPKANPYLFDDPEEILREASARRRGPRSPIKRDNTLAVVPQSQETYGPSNSIEHCTVATSSPLSSLHTTPEHEDPTSYTAATNVSPIASTDGSSERKGAPKARPTFRTPSPTKLAAPHVPSTPMSSATKKRKASARTLVKEPRSPGRLMTTSNPLLNEDCVIAYAESNDKENHQGVLRQVKGERAGVFTEEYVVFACRWFVGEE
jgi:hypothetical protein